MSRVTDRTDWYELWRDDKESILWTMLKNMLDDLSAGRSALGTGFYQQQEAFVDYQEEYRSQEEFLKEMTPEQLNKWCFYDLKNRGVIE